MKSDGFTKWQSLLEYTTCMRNVFTVWEKFFFNHQSIEWLTHDQIKEFLMQLRVTLDVLEGFHLFDTLSLLSIASEDSGFPRRRHLDNLKYELSDLRANDLAKNTRILKSSFLEILFSTVKINVPLLERISKAQAYEVLASSPIFLPYKFNGIEELRVKHGSRRAFLCSWERYVVQNLPVKYVMLFEVSDKWNGDEVDVQSLSTILCEETSLIIKMNDLARYIDTSHAMIHPKWIGRIIFGPVFISHLTEDSHQLQQALNRVAGDGETLSASRVIYEYVISQGEFATKSLTDSRGHFHECIQKFAVRRQDAEYVERGVTHLEKHLFAPHAVIQQLDDDYRKSIGHTLNSY